MVKVGNSTFSVGVALFVLTEGLLLTFTGAFLCVDLFFVFFTE